MNNQPERGPRALASDDQLRPGCFALVAYVPEPLASFVHDLRGQLPGHHNPRPHITVLPPRPLPGAREQVLEMVSALIDGWPPFEVELEEVCCFPETNVLYLSVGQGRSELHDLHSALTGHFPEHQEQFEFRPHLTLGGPSPAEETARLAGQAAKAWESATCARRFTVARLELLWRAEEGLPSEWERIWTRTLGRNGHDRQSPETAYTAETS